MKGISENASATVMDGAALAASVRRRVAQEAAAVAARGVTPGLRVLLVGENPASLSYVGSKTKAALEAGIRAETLRLPADVSPEALLGEVRRANADTEIHGILIQLPLPAGHSAARVLDSVNPLKDVDGFHPENVGRLHQGRPRFVPCTPAGILEMLDAYSVPLSGRRAVILGRSDIVGKPIAALLTARDATVTICHSKTRDAAAICREADVLIAAVGKPGFVTGEFVRPGAAVVDVGINRLSALEDVPQGLRRSPRVASAIAEKGRLLVGDVDYDDVAPVAGWITPVPGGVGPLTVAMLLANTVKAARLRLDLG
jgi:methylenetetrahydrofolate dehydrogenase (NADP+)/methenyltetrahydrofolate cyclohydrolase